MSDDRPDPQRLLSLANAADAAKGRGRLKVFLGAAPGVGKTFAMLEEGRRRATEGLDVVVGYAEPHSRPETESQLIGLEVLPNTMVEYRGVTLREFDLDAALARRPQLLLVDELAHTNAPGSRHPKRYQDVFELLDAGIDVYTTLNVQHLESLTDVVERIAGVPVRETLPDAVLERANEIELVDTSVDELLERLGTGKVYRSDVATQAVQNFFTRGNLTALRELALRKAAERVEQQRRESTHDAKPGRERLLVCVSASPLSARLVRATKRLADGLRATWVAASVQTPASATLGDAGRERITKHLELARRLGAEPVVLSGAGVVDTVLNYARSHGITKIVIGNTGQSWWRRLISGSFVDDLMRRSGDIDVYVVRGSNDPTPAEPRDPAGRRKLDAAGYAMAAAAVALATTIGWALHHSLAFSNANVLMVYMLGVVGVAVLRGRVPAILTAILSVLAFNFFFVPPLFTFAVADRQYVLTFGVMLLTGLTIAELTARLRGQAQFAYRRERSAETLNVLGTKLSRLDTPASIADVVVATLGEQYGLSNVSVLLMRDGTLGTVAGAGLDAKELAVARWAFDRGRVAGSGTETLPSARGLYQPLVARRGPVGVIGVSFTSAADAADPDVQRQIESVAAVTATAVERTRLADERAQAQARVEREFLRNTLLSSVSHDLRTPLTAIAGSASTLASPDIHLADADRRDLADSIVAEARRLERIVSNLLDMTRLESGGLTLRREPIDIAESIDAAVDAMHDTLGGRPVTLTIARDLPPADADPIAVGQVLVNLLDNAASHTPAGSPIEIVAASRDGMVEVGVVDSGPGIPAGFETRMFEKFQRSPTRHDDRRGLGLGLAICRGLIELHGGTIVGRNNSDGPGASVRFTLPIASTTMGPTNDLRS